MHYNLSEVDGLFHNNTNCSAKNAVKQVLFLKKIIKLYLICRQRKNIIKINISETKEKHNKNLYLKYKVLFFFYFQDACFIISLVAKKKYPSDDFANQCWLYATSTYYHNYKSL